MPTLHPISKSSAFINSILLRVARDTFASPTITGSRIATGETLPLFPVCQTTSKRVVSTASAFSLKAKAPFGNLEVKDRLKLSQGDDVDENVPLRKGAPKRSWRRDLESTKGFVLEADLQAGSRGVGWGRGIIQTEERHQAEKAREILYTSESDAFLSMCSLITPSRKSSQPASHPPSFRSFPVLYILNGE